MCGKRCRSLGCCLKLVACTLIGGELHMEDFEQGAMSNDGQHACVVVAVNALQFKIGDELECWEQVGLCSYGEIVTQPCELTARKRDGLLLFDS